MHFAIVTALFSCIAISSAHITGITGPAKYAPTTSSKYPLTFITTGGPITKYAPFPFDIAEHSPTPCYSEDFSALIGLGTSSTNPDGLGNFIHFYDLENTSTVGLWKFLRCDSRAHTHQGPGNFTLQVPLPKSSFNGAGSYIIKAAVTNAVGVSLRTLTIGLLNCGG